MKKITSTFLLGFLGLLIPLGFLLAPLQSVGQSFSTVTPINAVFSDKNTSEKPQSKVWKYDGKWWGAFPDNSDTYIWRLDGTSWTKALKISGATSVKADCKVVGNVVHILLWRKSGNSSELVSAEYVPATSTYKLWTSRPATAFIALSSGTETATIDIDGNGRMWLASDGTTDVFVRWSDFPYSTWSGNITIATGLTTDDISAVIAMPVQGQIGVFWSNQNSERFGFKTHQNGADPSSWSGDEVPASQSALNVGHGMGDDHLNLKMGSNGTLYCAVKTSYDTDGYPKISLLKRQPNGSWDNLYYVSDYGTRGIVILNESTGKLKVVFTSQELGGDILYRESPMSNISFGPTNTLISGTFDNPSSAKASYDSDIVIITADHEKIVGVLCTDGTPSPPNTPTLLTPANLATGIALNSNLSWNSTANTTSYHVQVSTESNFSSTVFDQNNIASTSVQPSGLSNSTLYYWRVQSNNGAGSSAWTAPWSFTTAAPLPAVPTLSSPADLATNIALNPTLSWNTAANATSYQTQVSTEANFSSTVFDQSNLSGTSVQVNGLLNNTVYYWRVRSSNGTDLSGWSSSRSFTTLPVPQLPAVPTLISPADLATNVAINPTLSWNSAANATSYQVQLSTVSNFTSTVLDQSNLPATSVQVNTLSNNTVYYWHVRSSNGTDLSAWSTTRSFTTIPTPQPPAVPTLISPADLATDVAINPTLSWNAAANATSYQVQVSTVSNFTSTVLDQSNLAATSVQVNTLSYNTVYYWHVRSSNGTDLSAWSTTRSFTTIATPQPPAVPTLASPADLATNVALNPTLSWNTAANATSYHAQVSTQSNFSSTVFDQSNLAATSVQVSGLLNNTVYYWRVQSSNGTDNSAYSSSWSFTTIAAPQLPAVPTLVSPADLATNVALNPTLSWNTAANATSYHTQVSTQSNFSSTVFDQSNLAGTSVQVNGLLNNTVYYWRVQSSNGTDNSAYSSSWSFTTIAAPQLPAVPTLVSPADLATNVALNPTLSWNTAANATSYHTQVSTQSNFSSTVFDQSNLAGTSVQVNGLLNNTVYYWRVQSSNGTDNSAYSSSWSFTTIAAPQLPAVPTLVSPADLATNVALNPTLSWNTAANATSYHAQVSTQSNFSSTVFDQSSIAGTSVQVNGLLNNTVYYWRVQSSNGTDNSAYSSSRSFTTVSASGGNSLVGNWRMNEGSGPTLVDNSGFGNNAQIFGSPSWSAGVAGSQLNLSGTSQYGSVPDASSLDITTSITMAAWIRPQVMKSQRILQKGTDVDGYLLNLLSTGKVSIEFNQISSSAYKLNSSALYPTNGTTWMHVAATYNGTTIKMYINGVENKSLNVTPAPINTNNLPLMIGSKNDGGSSFSGGLDDVRVYNYALSASEVLDLYNNPEGSSGGGSGARIASGGTIAEPLQQGESELSVTAFPNPAEDILNLEFGKHSGKEMMISISDPLGKTYFHTIEVVKDQMLINLNDLDMRSGLYLITTKSSEHFKITKLIKK